MAEFGVFLLRCSALTTVTRCVRASLDAGGGWGESRDMENRIAVLERDVHAIKSELAVIRRDHNDAKALSGRLQQVEVDLAAIKADTAQLQKTASQLMADFLKLKEEVGLIRIELMRLSTVQANCATKAGLIGVQAKVKEVEANIKGWMLVITLSLMTSVFAIVYPLYSLLRPTVPVKPVAVRAVQVQSIVAAVAPALPDSK